MANSQSLVQRMRPWRLGADVSAPWCGHRGMVINAICCHDGRGS